MDVVTPALEHRDGVASSFISFIPKARAGFGSESPQAAIWIRLTFALLSPHTSLIAGAVRAMMISVVVELHKIAGAKKLGVLSHSLQLVFLISFDCFPRKTMNFIKNQFDEKSEFAIIFISLLIITILFFIFSSTKLFEMSTV